MATRRTSTTAAAAIVHLRERGLQRHPGAELKSPWPGHLDLAVHGKTYAYLSAPGDPPHVSLKLPFSSALALSLPGSAPTGYGLGKSGWVSLSFDGHPVPPLAMLEEWLDESYRAQAPKKLLAQFGANGEVPAAPSTRAVSGRKKAVRTNAGRANADRTKTDRTKTERAQPGRKRSKP